MDVKKYALIVAGGNGSRMKSTIPKQFLLLQGRPILMHTVEAFHQYSPLIDLILVLPKKEVSTWKNLCDQFSFHISHTVVEGGDTRFQSVKNGLSAINDDSGVVAIHDGVRPLVSQSVLDKSYSCAIKKGNGVAAVPLKDSIRHEKNGTNRSVDRKEYYMVQTPQTFLVEHIKGAYLFGEDRGFTDDASVAEFSGVKINLIEGSYSNIKVTTPEDLLIAEALKRSNS